VSSVPKSNEALETALNSCTNASELRDTLIRTLSSQGVLVETRDSNFNSHLQVRQPQSTPAPAVALPANPATCVRRIYPHQNDQYEIYGASEAELDEKERQIRAMYGGQR
jgi:hypothetical protein